MRAEDGKQINIKPHSQTNILSLVSQRGFEWVFFHFKGSSWANCGSSYNFNWLHDTLIRPVSHV